VTNHPRSLHYALARWEAESVAHRNLCNLPYDMEGFVAGFLLGATDGMDITTDIRHSSIRAGFRAGRQSLEIWAREQSHP
jgi:hypothetical protein